MITREKKHRLTIESYKGEISVAFTLCLKENPNFFVEREIVKKFTDILDSEVVKNGCIVPVFCFMPDHQHVILTGRSSESNMWKAMVGYKQKTGFGLSKNRPGISWQKDFFDHVIRAEEDVRAQVKYVLDNPVRKGLVSSWEEYPFKGCIGCKLEDVLLGIM